MDSESLMTFELEQSHIPILKPSLEDNFILLQTPVQKNLKVRFQTPARTPLSAVQPINLCELSPNPVDSKLDDDSWRERIEVVTKFDHEDYVNSAKEFIEEIIQNVVVRSSSKDTAVQLTQVSDPDKSNKVISGDYVSSDAVDKENISPLCAAFKSKKAKKKKEIPIPDDKLSSSTAYDVIEPSDSTGISPIDEVVIELCEPEKDTKGSKLKTIYSIFDADDLPEDLQAEAERAAQLCSKKTPISMQSEAKKLKPLVPKHILGTSPGKDKREVATKKLTAARPSPPERPPPEPPMNKHFTSIELKEPRSQSTFDDEEFHDAHSLLESGFEFDLSFLESKGTGKVTSDLRKQSLYRKFDPLVAGENPQRCRNMIGRKSDIIDLDGHVGLKHFTEQPIKKKTAGFAVQPDLLCASPSAYATTVGQSSAQIQCNFGRDKTDTKSSNSRESWLSVQQPEDMKEGIIELLKYTEADVDRMKKPLAEKIFSLTEELSSQKQKLDQMQVVLQEYETTVLEMAQKYEEEKENLTKEKTNLCTEQDKTISHLESVEKAYLELLQRSEQMKVGIGNYKVNEETYKKVITEYQTAQEEAQQRYQALKTTVEESQEKLKEEIAEERKEFRSQTAALKARCKCLENQAKSLQLQLDQKTTENTELTKICDELIDQQQSSLMS